MTTDEELVSKFRNGELNAGGLLYSRYKVQIHTFCRRMLNDRELANDATQETFMKMMTKIQLLNNHIAFKSWLFAIARNEVLMIVRRSKIVPMEAFDEEISEVWDETTPFTVTVESELQALLQRAIECLKPAYREAVLLRDVEQMTYEEIARATNSTVSAVKSKLFKARIVLNEKLAPYFKGRK